MEHDTFLRKKQKKKDSATIMIPIDGIGTVFPMNLKENRLNKHFLKKFFFLNLMNLIETNQQINMTYDHSVSRNNLFKSHVNVETLNILLTL